MLEIDCAPIVDNEEYPALLVHGVDGETELAEVENAMTVDDTCWEKVAGCVEDRGCTKDVDVVVGTSCDEETGCVEDRAWLEETGEIDERGVVGGGEGVEDDIVEDEEGGALLDAAVAPRDTPAANGVCFAPAPFTGLKPPW